MEFRLLGPLETRVGGEPMRVPPKQRAVLATLLLARSAVVSADALVEALWDSPPRSARNQVQVYVSALRRQLAPEPVPQRPPTPVAIQTHAAGYRLELPPAALDLHHFEVLVAGAERCAVAGDLAAASEKLRAALALWRGPALANVDGPLAAAEAARLGERRLGVIERRIDTDLALCRYTELVPELTALVAEYPLHEGIRRRLMMALYACGRGAQALAVYRDGRRALVADLGIEPGPGLRELEVAILRGEPIDYPIVGLPQPTVAPAPVCQLPAASDPFVGRDAAARAMLDVLVIPRPVPPTIVLTGPPGVGKSTLAVHVAHSARPCFPGGVLYADLRGSTATPADPQAVLADFLVALGVGGWNAVGAAQVAMYRSLLADRRVLVVLDDARDERQVRPLLPTAAGSAAVVCGRGGLAALGGTRVPVRVPVPDDAVAMLAGIVGVRRVAAEPDAAAAVVTACGHLPLAIRIAGCRLAARPHRTVAWLAGLLSDPRQRLDELAVGDLSVRDAYGGTWARLSVPAREALTAMAGRMDVTVAGVAARLGVAAAAADRVIDDLVNVHLLEPVTGGEAVHYRMTELTGLYAAAATSH